MPTTDYNEVLVSDLPKLFVEQEKERAEQQELFEQLYEFMGGRAMPCPGTTTPTTSIGAGCLPVTQSAGCLSTTCGANEPCGLAVEVMQWIARGSKRVPAIAATSCPDGGLSRAEILCAVNTEEINAFYGQIKAKDNAEVSVGRLVGSGGDYVNGSGFAFGIRENENNILAASLDGALWLKPQESAPCEGRNGMMYHQDGEGILLWDSVLGDWRGL